MGGSITPILDTLLSQTLGRRADMARFTSSQTYSTLLNAQRPTIVRDATQGAREQRAKQQNTEARQLDKGQKSEQDKTQATRAGRQIGQHALSLAGSGQQQSAQFSSAKPHLSQAARVISTLLARLPESPMTVQKAPLFSGQGMLVSSAMAAMLAQQLAQSGLFYEAHLLKWLNGQYSSHQIKKESQEKTAQHAKTTTSQNQSKATPSKTSQTGSQAQQAQHESASQQPTAPQSGGTKPGESLSSLIQQNQMSTVRQQLDVLSTSVFRWEGLAWPDAPMQWEIEEHEQPESQGEQKEGQKNGYTTKLNLELPKLGILEVHMSLLDKNIYMFAWPQSEVGRKAMQPKIQDLQKRLESIGFQSALVELLAQDNHGRTE